ncbi:hypothetical protein A7P25_25395 [Achromobacter xylosoxidans]|nr:hypothetical protein A7P25_25395 [Achromobacter xylosoxidans]
MEIRPINRNRNNLIGWKQLLDMLHTFFTCTIAERNKNSLSINQHISSFNRMVRYLMERNILLLQPIG